MKRKRINSPKFAPFVLTAGPFKGKTVELSSQESLTFVSKMADHFLAHVLRCPEALITDESYITDFETWGERTQKFRREIVSRGKKVYGVDISDVFDEPIPKILHFIKAQQSKKS